MPSFITRALVVLFETYSGGTLFLIPHPHPIPPAQVQELKKRTGKKGLKSDLESI